MRPGGWHHTTETKKKLSSHHQGHPHTPETRAKISATLKGRTPSLEVRKNMSAAHEGKVGPLSSHWNGGRFLNRGYVFILAPNHPHATALGYVLEHRLVMEAHLGRTLLPREVVHHINGNPADNRIENLMLFSSHGEHISRAHKKGDKKP